MPIVYRPARADELHATIPGAHLVVIPYAGHSPQEDNPAAWLAWLILVFAIVRGRRRMRASGGPVVSRRGDFV